MFLLESWEFEQKWAFGHEMGRMGQWLEEGKGFTLDGSSPTAKFPPFYPLFVGGIFYLFGPYTKAAAVALFLSQSLFSAAIAICLANMGNRLFGGITGMIAGWAWVFYPTSIFYSVVRIWYSELAMLLILLVIIIAVTTQYPPSFGRIALLGALSGLTVLTDSTMALYLPFLFLWILVAWRVHSSRLIVSVTVWGVAAGIVASPWMIRNWLVLGSPMLLKANFGMELFIGNVPGASITDMRQKFAALQEKDPDSGNGWSEIAYYRYLQNKALEWIQEHPLSFLSLTARRIFYFWLLNPAQGWESRLRLIFFSPLIVLALCGVRHAGGRRWQLAPLWLFLLIYPMPYYLAHVNHGRYSYPVEPLVLLLAASFIAIWFTRDSNAVVFQQAAVNERPGIGEVQRSA
jgi:4-amino-4-deoxy-L-arabinose transferase-like glycosyltransferase